MIKLISLTLSISVGAACGLLAQGSPTPEPSPPETVSPGPTPAPSPSAFASPGAAPVRNVALKFVPPPMEGTISLGIFDSNQKLVRVLHRESSIDKFTIDENSLNTTWDGKNDAGEASPPGKYRARGYLVAKLKVEDVGKVNAPPDNATDHVPVKLVTNPLVADTRSTVDLAVGFDSKGSFLKTTDGLPLASINESPNLSHVAIEKGGEKTADVWQTDENGAEHFRISNIDKMMAFDCGYFELR